MHVHSSWRCSERTTWRESSLIGRDHLNHLGVGVPVDQIAGFAVETTLVGLCQTNEHNFVWKVQGKWWLGYNDGACLAPSRL
jgi:hypothetical protein